MSRIYTETESPVKIVGRNRSLQLLGTDQGCTGGFSLGISFYGDTDFSGPAYHEDQEAFFVLEGTGMVRLGNKEFPILPGDSFLARPGEGHGLKRDSDSGPVKVLWSHGAP